MPKNRPLGMCECGKIGHKLKDSDWVCERCHKLELKVKFPKQKEYKNPIRNIILFKIACDQYFKRHGIL